MKKVIGILAITALGFLAIGIHSCISTSKFLKEAIEVKGVVIKNECVYTTGGNSSCSPIVGFVDLNGQSHVFLSNVDAKYDIDEIITVVYPKGHPKSAEIKSWFHWWGLATMTIGGCGLTMVPLLIILAAKLGFIVVIDGDELEDEE